MKFLLYWHPAVSVTFLSIITVTISYLCLRLVRKRFTGEFLRENHEVGGYIFNAFGLIYAVLVAFVVFVTWTEYDDAEENVHAEANELISLKLYAHAFPNEIKNKLLSEIASYTHSVIYDEWQFMEKEAVSENTQQSYYNLWSAYTSIEPDKLRNTELYKQSLSHLNLLEEKRRERLFDSRDSIPSIIWGVLFFCGILSICYTFLFFTRIFSLQIIMTSGLTVTNTFILYMIYVLDHPFVGYSKVTPEAFISVMSLLYN